MLTGADFVQQGLLSIVGSDDWMARKSFCGHVDEGKPSPGLLKPHEYMFQLETDGHEMGPLVERRRLADTIKALVGAVFFMSANHWAANCQYMLDVLGLSGQTAWSQLFEEKHPTVISAIGKAEWDEYRETFGKYALAQPNIKPRESRFLPLIR